MRKAIRFCMMGSLCISLLCACGGQAEESDETQSLEGVETIVSEEQTEVTEIESMETEAIGTESTETEAMETESTETEKDASELETEVEAEESGNNYLKDEYDFSQMGFGEDTATLYNGVTLELSRQPNTNTGISNTYEFEDSLGFEPFNDTRIEYNNATIVLAIDEDREPHIALSGEYELEQTSLNDQVHVNGERVTEYRYNLYAGGDFICSFTLYSFPGDETMEEMDMEGFTLYPFANMTISGETLEDNTARCFVKHFGNPAKINAYKYDDGNMTFRYSYKTEQNLIGDMWSEGSHIYITPVTYANELLMITAEDGLTIEEIYIYLTIN